MRVGLVSTALVCAALLMIVGCGKKIETGVSVDPAFPTLVPPDTTILVGVRLDKIKAAPLYQKYGADIDIARLNEFSQRTGLDPLQDIASVLVASDGTQSIAAARGHFSPDQLSAKLTGRGASSTIYKKYTLIGGDRDAAVFINPGLALAGPERDLRAVLDSRDRSETGIPANLQARLKSLPKDDQIYVVSSAGIPVSAFPARSDVQSSLSNIVGFINGLTAGLAVDDSLHFSAEIDCISDAGAKRVNDALRGGIGLARLTTKDNQLGLLRLYDSVHVDQQESAVRIRADVTDDQLAMLIKAFPELRPQK